VVTSTGAVVFTSKGGPPFRARDFVSFQSTGVLPQQARRSIAALLGMSREGLLGRASRPELTAKGSDGVGDDTIQ
jgi:hypothetical protein